MIQVDRTGPFGDAAVSQDGGLGAALTRVASLRPTVHRHRIGAVVARVGFRYGSAGAVVAARLGADLGSRAPATATATAAAGAAAAARAAGAAPGAASS